jgi:SAM-dependent methyltransferase
MNDTTNHANANAGLGSLIGRGAPEPWAEGDNIPWNEPEFSERMLAEHLSQDHDMASRRAPVIDAQVEWIHAGLLGARPSRVLDLGCGPGLYSSRLARLGHECLGIDFSPASIRYARETADRAAGALQLRYELADLREAEYGGPRDLAMLIFGELNVFRPGDAALILGKAARALRSGGKLLLEVHDYATIEALGRAAPSWRASPGGLFSPRPHILLSEQHWDRGRSVATIRHDVVDAASGSVAHFAQSMQAWTEAGYRGLLEEAGFVDAEFLPGFGSVPPMPGLFVIVAGKR